MFWSERFWATAFMEAAGTIDVGSALCGIDINVIQEMNKQMARTATSRAVLNSKIA